MAGGCKTYQAAHATSGSGLNLNASVPVPYSGGQTIIGVNLMAGYWKQGDIIQPTSTNSTGSPSVAIAIGTTGSASATGTVANTNNAAILGAADREHLIVLTGQATETSSNFNLTTGK